MRAPTERATDSRMRIYLDHAATSPLRPEVLAAMQPYLTDPALMGNPSSLHHEGKTAQRLLDGCHERAAAYFGCKGSDIVFNSGGSEGDTHALLGTARLLDRPIHVAVTAIEHKAVLHAAERLKQMGHRITLLPVDGDGVLRIEALTELMRKTRPDLISVMAVNNEIGTVQLIEEIAELCQAHEVLLHSDAVQAVGHGMGELLKDGRIDLLTITAHKFGGPRGVGLLVQRGRRLPALVCGGPQEGGCRAGTENLAGVIGLQAALDLAEGENSVVHAQHLRELRDHFEVGLRERFPDCTIHGSAAPRAPHISSFSLPGRKAKDLQKHLDRKGFAVGLGSACTGCTGKMSHVLEAMGVKPEMAGGTIRVSLGPNSTKPVSRELDLILHQL